jgi:signal transduction histidine kinase
MRLEAFRLADRTEEWRTKDGRWFRLVDRRTTEGGTVSLRDEITDSKLRETELRQAQKMEALGQLTGGVAHDFNNLMQVILGYAALAMKATGPEHPVGEYLTHIRAAGQRAAEVTNHLLTFSRKLVLNPGPVDLNALLAAQARLLERMLGEGIHVDVRPLAGLQQVVADRGLLEQAIMNLVINARDALPHGGTILLSTDRADVDAEFCREHPWARPGAYALVRCADTGVGMSREARERLFEPFFTTKEPGKGTGLGLAMVYGIVRQHDGMVFVESEEGRGTTFTIYLPVS